MFRNSLTVTGNCSLKQIKPATIHLLTSVRLWRPVTIPWSIKTIVYQIASSPLLHEPNAIKVLKIVFLFVNSSRDKLPFLNMDLKFENEHVKLGTEFNFV